MAKRRLISAQLICDEEFNSLSLEAQNLFIRMLAVADDCGVIPSSTYTLGVLINPPGAYRAALHERVEEIVGKGLGTFIEHQGKEYFVFKRRSFDAHQSFILNKRTKSEYLGLSFADFSSTFFREVQGKSPPAKVESRKKRVARRENPVRSSDTPSAEGVYDRYAGKVRAGARAGAIRSIRKLLPVYPANILMTCVDRYAASGLSPDVKFRVQANNFFGRDERFKEFLPDRAHEGHAPGIGNTDGDGPTQAQIHFAEEEAS
jgi:hypothetical protein